MSGGRPDGADAGDDHDGLDAAVEAVHKHLGGRSVACAESCTAGLIAQSLAAGDGASFWFQGGIVTYHRSAKGILGVDGSHPVVTAPVARRMAAGAAELFGTEAAVATTGAAGPTGLDGAPPGTVVIGWYVDGATGAETLSLEGDPATVCRNAARYALTLLAARLADAERAAGAGGEPGAGTGADRT